MQNCLDWENNLPLLLKLLFLIIVVCCLSFLSRVGKNLECKWYVRNWVFARFDVVKICDLHLARREWGVHRSWTRWFESQLKCTWPLIFLFCTNHFFSFPLILLRSWGSNPRNEVFGLNFYFKMGHFSLFSSFQYSWQKTWNIIFCRWMDSNRGSLKLEATTLPTEPQVLPEVLFTSIFK